MPPWCRGTKSWPWNCLKRAVRAMGAANIACCAIFEQFGPQKCMVGPHILQPGCFERQSKVAQSARWGYATTPKIPHRTFLRNGFEDIVCGIHPRELLQIQIWPIVSTVSLVHVSIVGTECGPASERRRGRRARGPCRRQSAGPGRQAHSVRPDRSGSYPR